MKRIVSIVLSIALLLSLFNIVSAQEVTPANVTVLLEGEKLEFSQEPVIVNGRTLVPLRAIFEALGADIDWNGDTKTVTATKESDTVKLTIDNSIAYKNSDSITLEAPPIIVNGNTMVPARFIAESFGLEVGWDANTRKISLDSEQNVSNSSDEPTNNVSVDVLRVVDGDTIVVDFNDTKERVRFIGVDTPETVHPELGEEPFGKEASDYTKQRLEGQTIELEFDVQERDQYGRLLAYIWIGNEHLNATMLKEGYATLSTWPPNVKYVDEFTQYQKQAREAQKGLWGIDDIAEQ